MNIRPAHMISQFYLFCFHMQTLVKMRSPLYLLIKFMVWTVDVETRNCWKLINKVMQVVGPIDHYYLHRTPY